MNNGLFGTKIPNINVETMLMRSDMKCVLKTKTKMSQQTYYAKSLVCNISQFCPTCLCCSDLHMLNKGAYLDHHGWWRSL